MITTEVLPKELVEDLARFEKGKNDYASCENLKKKFRKQGYTFDYGLDARPYNIRKTRKK